MDARYSAPIIKDVLQVTPHLTVSEIANITGFTWEHIHYVVNHSEYCLGFIRTYNGNDPSTYENV
jgi:hypothetical protein